MKKALFTFFSVLAVPVLTLAQDFRYTDKVINKGHTYLISAVTILMVLMTVWFLISVFNFIREKDPGKMKERRTQMINGLIGLFVAVAVWGIIRIAQNIVGVDTGNNGSVNITCPPGYIAIGGKCEIR